MCSPRGRDCEPQVENWCLHAHCISIHGTIKTNVSSLCILIIYYLITIFWGISYMITYLHNFHPSFSFTIPSMFHQLFKLITSSLAMLYTCTLHTHIYVHTETRILRGIYRVAHMFMCLGTITCSWFNLAEMSALERLGFLLRSSQYLIDFKKGWAPVRVPPSILWCQLVLSICSSSVYYDII